jgi:hypothetical protein
MTQMLKDYIKLLHAELSSHEDYYQKTNDEYIRGRIEEIKSFISRLETIINL